jgi:hypothetical protein
MKLRRDMLLALVKKDMYPGDPEKRELIYNKYAEKFDIGIRILLHAIHKNYFFDIMVFLKIDLYNLGSLGQMIYFDSMFH